MSVRSIPQSWWVRLGFWTVSGLAAFWVAIAGLFLLAFAVPKSAADATMSTGGRLLWGSVGIAAAIAGLAVLVVVVRRWQTQFRAVRPA